jgi:hypothetical protein
MNTPSQNVSLTDFYFEFLKNLNPDSKLDLIAKLSQSLRKNESEKTTSLQALFGAYKSEETAEEIISVIRSARTFNRHTESL